MYEDSYRPYLLELHCIFISTSISFLSWRVYIRFYCSIQDKITDVHATDNIARRKECYIPVDWIVRWYQTIVKTTRKRKLVWTAADEWHLYVNQINPKLYQNWNNSKTVGLRPTPIALRLFLRMLAAKYSRRPFQDPQEEVQRFYKKRKKKEKKKEKRPHYRGAVREMVCQYTRARGECILSLISANEASQKRGSRATKQPGTKLPSKRVANTI